jgi:hypothetical protein
VSNCQYLWIKIFYAAASFVVASSGRSMSLPFSNFAPGADERDQVWRVDGAPA